MTSVVTPSSVKGLLEEPATPISTTYQTIWSNDRMV